jgi:sugar phosphate permease
VNETLRKEGRGAAPWTLLGFLFALNVLGNTDQRILLLLVDPIKTDLALSDFQMSLLLGPAFALFYAIFGIPLGWAADRFSRPKVIWLGVTAWSCFTVASGFMRSFGGLFAMRAGVGIGEASLTPAAYSLVAERFPQNRRSLALAIFSFAPKVGLSMALIVGGFIVQAAGSISASGVPPLGGMRPWQICFILIGVPGFFAAWFALLIGERRHVPTAAALAQGPSEGLWRYVVEYRRTVIPLVLAYGMMAFSAGAVLSWAPAYMARKFHYGPESAGPALGLISLAALVTLVLKAAAVDWLFARGHRDIYVRFYLWILLVTLPLPVVAFLTGQVWLFLALFGILQTLTLSFPMFQALTAQAIAPADLRGRMAGLFLFATNCLVGLGPMLPAALSDYVLKGPDRLGPAIAISATGATGIAMALFWFAMPGFGRMIEQLDANARPKTDAL